MNVSKMKELILQKCNDFLQSVMINGQMLEMVEFFKYLDSYTDFYFVENTNHIKELSGRLHLLCKISNFSVSHKSGEVYV